MEYKKFFLPVGGGEELRERLYGALLIAKYFKVHLEILQSFPSVKSQASNMIPSVVLEQIEGAISDHYKFESEEFRELFEEVAKELDVEITDEYKYGVATVHLNIQHGNRGTMVAQESKFCDLVVAAAPPQGNMTATFEAAVLESGNPVIMIPRIMKKFDTKKIIIGWNNSPEASRAITSSLDLLKQANKVHIVSSKEYTPDLAKMEKLQEYLSRHGVETTAELVPLKRHPGETLLTAANKGNYDLIVAGAFGHKGLREIMFGAATKYLFEHSKIPVFMSH